MPFSISSLHSPSGGIKSGSGSGSGSGIVPSEIPEHFFYHPELSESHSEKLPFKSRPPEVFLVQDSGAELAGDPSLVQNHPESGSWRSNYYPPSPVKGLNPAPCVLLVPGSSLGPSQVISPGQTQTIRAHTPTAALKYLTPDKTQRFYTIISAAPIISTANKQINKQIN